MSLFAIFNEASNSELLQYFSYQIVSRVVIETKIGNKVRIREFQSVSYVLIHNVLHNKVRLYNR